MPELQAQPPMNYRLLEQLPTSDEEWMDDAKCVDADPDIFFPSRGDDTQVAKKICAVCEVWAECLEYALENEQDDGIWGGFSERQRLAMKKLGARALHMQNDELSA